MNRSYTNNSIAFMLFVSLLANGLAWTFYEEIFTHESNHHIPLTQKENTRCNQHKNLADDRIIDSIIHLSLHAVGQYQPFYFTFPPYIPTVTSKETLATFILAFIPESILNSLFRPPKSIFLS